MKISIAILFLVLFHLISVKLNAQEVSCAQMIKDAQKETNYRKAILKLNAAKRCDPSLENIADSLTLLIFDKVDSLNENLEKATNEALEAKKFAESNRDIAIRNKEVSDSLRILSDKNEQLLSSFATNVFSFFKDNEQFDDYIEWIVENQAGDDFPKVIEYVIKDSDISDYLKDHYLDKLHDEESIRIIAWIYTVFGETWAEDYSKKNIAIDTIVNKEVFGKYWLFSEFENKYLVYDKSRMRQMNILQVLEKYPENSYCKFTHGLIDTSNTFSKPYLYLVDYERLFARLKVMARNFEKAGFEKLATKASESMIDVGKDAAVLFPDVFDYRVLLAKAYFEYGDYEHAKDEFLKLQANFPNENEDGMSLYLGYCYVFLKMYDDAINPLKKFIRSNENSKIGLDALMISYSGAGKYGEAYDVAKRLVELYPKTFDHYWYKSYYSLFINKPQEAISTAKKSLELFPEEIKIVRLLALGYVLNNDFEKAEKKYNEWMNIPYPEGYRTFGWKFIADIYSLIEKGIDQAEFEEVKALLSKEDSMFVKQRRMYSYPVTEYQKAYKLSQELIKMDSGYYSYYWNNSYYCLFIDKPQEAISAAKKSLALAPDETGVITNLVLGYLLNDQFEEANRIFLEWKDKPFPGEKHTFGEQFLEDIEELQEKGVAHKDFEKAKTLLEN